MALHACMNGDVIVSKVDIISEDQYQLLATSYSTLIDISQLTPEPQIGWVNVNGVLSDPVVTPEQIQANLEKNITGPAIEFGIKLKKELTAKIGAKNLMLGKTMTEISSLVSSLVSIGFILEGGALYTAKDAMEQAKAGYPDYTTEFDYGIAKINEFLNY